MQTTTPYHTPSPQQAQARPNTPRFSQRARKLATALWFRLANPRVRELPIGHPDALVDRPGERRIIFGHKVIIIRDQQPPRDEK